MKTNFRKLNLRNYNDTTLLEFVRVIISAARSLNASDKADLLLINDEFIRRDAARAQKLCAYCLKQTLSGHCSNCGGL